MVKDKIEERNKETLKKSISIFSFQLLKYSLSNDYIKYLIK